MSISDFIHDVEGYYTSLRASILRVSGLANPSPRLITRTTLPTVNMVVDIIITVCRELHL